MRLCTESQKFAYQSTRLRALLSNDCLRCSALFLSRDREGAVFALFQSWVQGYRGYREVLVCPAPLSSFPFNR
jgi:hypothetical protein